MPTNNQVTVIYALPDTQWQQQLAITTGLTVQQVLANSQLFTAHPELLQQPLLVGIWGKRVELTHIVQAGDRVEIYRPLQIDPKQARKLKAPKMPRRKH
jgi:hypothetical protein